MENSKPVITDADESIRVPVGTVSAVSRVREDLA